MRISVLAIDQAKSGPQAELRQDYLQRLQRIGRTVGINGVHFEPYPESKRRSASERKLEEANRLLSARGPKSKTVVLSERGKQYASGEFAKWLSRELDDGCAELCFLIGGPDGHDATTENDADMVLSLGAMTWPHRLVQVMLVEQIYRAVTILANHPYHRA